MKKSLSILALAFGVSGAFAQDLTSKKGEQILPEAKDWSIGIDANPFLEYMGNFFGKTANNSAPAFNFLNSNQTITGKYFMDAQTAYRASVRLGFGGNSQRRMVDDRKYLATTPGTVSTYPDMVQQVENVWKRSSTNIGLSVGIEKRRGKTRLQGFYGAEAGINFSSTRDKFTYGNELSASPGATLQIDVDPTDDLFNGSNNIQSYTSSVGGNTTNARVTDRKNGSVFSFGVRGFVGVEYFIIPKVSLGGEFGWGLGLSMQGKTKTTLESIGTKDGINFNTGSTTIESSKNGGWALDTDNRNSIFGPSASLRLNFYF